MINRPLFEKIAKGLSNCMPETLQEREQECFECPYFEECNGTEESISLPAGLVIDIRKYFSGNWSGKDLIQ